MMPHTGNNLYIGDFISSSFSSILGLHSLSRFENKAVKKIPNSGWKVGENEKWITKLCSPNVLIKAVIAICVSSWYETENWALKDLNFIIDRKAFNVEDSVDSSVYWIFNILKLISVFVLLLDECHMFCI